MEDKRGYRSTEILFKHDGDLTPVQGKREGSLEANITAGTVE